MDASHKSVMLAVVQMDCTLGEVCRIAINWVQPHSL
jgi:hypothetical protein